MSRRFTFCRYVFNATSFELFFHCIFLFLMASTAAIGSFKLKKQVQFLVSIERRKFNHRIGQKEGN